MRGLKPMPRCSFYGGSPIDLQHGNGELSYDSDGNGSVAAVLLEVLASAPTVAASDIWIV